MAPFTAWLPVRPSQDFDLIIKIVAPDASALLAEWSPIAQLLLERGYTVMAQRGRLDGDLSPCALRIRIAIRTFYSMGDGCDVLVNLSGPLPELGRFGLQPGSVILFEPPTDPQPHPMLPDGVIPYHVPFSSLCAEQGEGVASKGSAALGTLLQLLGLQEEILPRLTPVVAAPRSFAAGWDYARRMIAKHDAYSLPLASTAGAPGQVLLTAHQAVMAGFAACACECGEACSSELHKSAAQWVTRHTGMAGSTVSVIESTGWPGVQAYRGPQGKVMALLRGNDAAIASCLKGAQLPAVFVAADLADAMRLLIAGHDLIRLGLSDGVGVLIEETLTRRYQTVAVRSLIDMIRRGQVMVPPTADRSGQGGAVATSERDGDAEADVGFVAWGTMQGVVRDAVALCRSFGLRVAGLYPKRIVPFPHEDVEAFAKTVGRVVLVESGQTQGFWNRLCTTFSFKSVVLTPAPGTSLTPMDIFLREGLGAV